MKLPTLYIIAGANGVGKSTFGSNAAKTMQTKFIDMDMIIKNYYGFYPQRLEDMREGIQETNRQFLEAIKNKKDFFVERILIDRDEKMILKAKNEGFSISLVYIGLADIKMSIKRVEKRFIAGGHNVNIDDIKGNYTDSFQGLEKFKKHIDMLYLCDNTNKFRVFFIAKRDENEINVIHKSENIPEWAQKTIESYATDNIKSTGKKWQQR